MAITGEIPVVAESRRSQRFLYSVPVQIYGRDPESLEGEIEIMTVVSHDLSESGMRIFSTIPLNQKMVFIRFNGPKQATISKEANLVRFKRCNKWMWEYGLRFESPIPLSMLKVDAGG